MITKKLVWKALESEIAHEKNFCTKEFEKMLQPN